MPAQEITRAEVQAARLYPTDVTASQLHQRVSEVARRLHALGYPDTAAQVWGDAEVLRDAGAEVGEGLAGLRTRLITLADVALSLVRVIRAYGLLAADEGPAAPVTVAAPPVYRAHLTPDAAVEVEPSGCVVLVTPERRITVTNVGEWTEQLGFARTTAQAVGSG